MPEDKLKVLHQNLVKAGYDLPDETTFRKDMADDAKRAKFHSNLVKEGYELPDIETFSVDMGFKKKVPTTPVSSNGSSPTPPTSGSGVSPVRDVRGINPKLSFLADVVSDLNPNAPKLQPGQSVSEWGKNLTDYAKQYPMVKDGEPYKKEEIAQRLRFKAQQRNKDFETFMDEKVVETADLPEYDQNIKLYRDYLAHNEPEKLRQFDEKRNYQSGLPYGIGNLSEEDRQRLDAEFYDKALENKQRYLNIKWNDLKSTIASPEFQRMLSIQQSTAQEIEAMNRSYQEGNLSEENYKSNYEQLKNRFDGVSMQVDPVMARAKELRDVTQRNINEAEVWIKRYPLEAQRRLKEIADDAYDEAMYQVMPSQKAAANFTNQVGRGVTEFLANVVSLPQVFSQDDSYGATDRLADVSQQWANDINDDLFPIPKRMNEGVVNKDFTVNWDLVFPKTVRTLTDMGIMAATGTPAGMVATSFAMNAKDYYDEGLAQGMKPSEASQFSVVMGTQQALLELVNPEAALLRKGLTKMGTQEAMGMLTKGVPMKEVVKQVAKSTTKNIAMENTQEILQNIGDMTGKLAANALTGSEFDFSDVERDMKETILLTTIVAGLSGGGIASTQNSRSELEKRALYSAIDSPEMLLAATQKAVSQGIMDEATATKINMTAGVLKQNLDALPATVSETERSEVVNALFDKSKLMEVAANENLDPAIRKVYENKIGELDAAVGKVISKYIPKEGVEVTQVETPRAVVEEEVIVPEQEEEVVSEQVIETPTEEIVATEAAEPAQSTQKADVEKTLYGTISGSIPLSQALPNGVYVDLGDGLFAYADKGDKIAAIVDKSNGYTVSKSFWNDNTNTWQLPNQSNLKDDAKRFGVDEKTYIKKYQDAVNNLNAKYDAELATLEETSGVSGSALKDVDLVKDNGKKIISKALGENENDASDFKNTKVVDDNGKPKQVFHGTWADAPFEDFKEGDTYFTDNYDTAKMFGSNREGGVDTENMDMQGKPFVMEVTDTKGKKHKMVIANTDMASIFSDLQYDVSPVGEWGKEDLNAFDASSIEHHFGIPENKIKSFKIEERQVGKNVDDFGVSRHYINLENPLIIDAKGDIWNGSKGGDIQGKINEARESGKHDGVIVKNIVEGGLGNPDTKPTTTYVVFNKNPQSPPQYTEAATPAKKQSEGVSGSALKDVEGKKADIDRRTQEEFNNENESYRVIVGDEAFNDIIESGVVRTNADSKKAKTIAEKLASRPTLFPSFSKGKASMEYAAANPNNYIIVTEDPSIQPSTAGRHGKGTTMFPTDKNGNHLKELSGEKVKVYKHIGNGEYILVYANGKVLEQQVKKDTPAKSEAVKEDTVEITNISDPKEEIIKEPTAKQVKDDKENGRFVEFKFQNLEDIPKILLDEFGYVNVGWDSKNNRPKYYRVNMTQSEADYYLKVAKGLPIPNEKLQPTPEGTQEGITPTTDEKRNEEGQQVREGLLTKEAEVATNIPEAPPLTKVFVATSGNTIEENEMGNLVVKGKRGGILTGKERNKVIREYRKEKMTGGKRVTSADLERDNITEPEAVRYIAENSTSPEQLLEMMAVVEPKDAKLSGKDSFIADNMDAISAESWAKFGDTNRITPDIKKNFIRKNGTGIDQIAQAASYAMNPEGDGTEITPKDVIDFVEANQKGIKEALKAGNEDMKVLYDAFVSLTGRAPTRSMIADVKKEGADKKIEEDFGMEPESQDFSVSDSPQMKKRRFTNKVMADKATKGTTKAKITEEAIYYLEQKNEMSVGEANKILQDVGMDDAIAILKDVGNGINGGVRSVLGQVIIKELEATGRVDIAIDTLNWLTEKATDSGQFIQAFALWGYLTPAGQIRSAKRLIDEQRKDQFKKDSDKIKKTKRIIRDIQKEAIDETLANVGVEKKVGVRVNTNTKRSSPSYGSKNKVVTREKYLEAKAKLKGKLFSNPLDPALIPIATYHLEASGRKFADFATNLLDEFGSAVRPYIKDMYAAAKEELGGTGYDTIEDMDRVIAESQNEVWTERAKKITAKFDRALKTKSEKLFNEAVSELQSLPNKEELWEKYKNFAASRLKNLPAALFEKEAREKPALQNFTDELVRVFREKMQEAMSESESKSTPKKTRSSAEIIGDAFKNKEKYAEVWEEAQKQMREKFTEEELIEIDNYFGAILDTPFSQKQIERVVKDGLKSIDKKVADIARAHFTQYDATKQTLIDKLVNEADLDFMQAKELGDAISKEFDRIMASKKSEILERMFQEKVTTKKGKVKHDLETELEKLLNLGAFSDEAIMNMWADANGYPKLTEENYKELERLAAIVVATPDGSKKFKAIQDLLKYQATIKGVNWKEVGMAIWYANILSGYNTQLVNAVSTAINVMSNLMVTSVRSMLGKGDSRMAVKGLYDGFASGLLVAKDVLQTGYSPIFTGKIEMPSALEIKRFMGGKYNPANWLKFVRRVMVATDVIFFEAAKEMRAYQLAAKMAREEGKVDPDLDTKNRALAILNKTDFDQKKIIQEETIEYEHELDRINEMDVPAAMKEKLRKQALKGRSRRIFEITQQNRDLSIIEQSADFAARSTYNYPPEGALGALVKGINNWLNKLPFLRFFIPFTNIIANVANEQINYTPLGAVRAFRGGSITGNRPTEISAIDKADMYTKAAIGTTLMVLTYILARGFGDDDEPILEITANGTGDYGKNYNLIKEGWQQYSFRFKKPDGTYTDWISYQYSPLQVGLSMIGNLMDFEKYRGEKADDETALKKLSLAFSASTRTFLDATFLSSLNDLLLIATNPFSEDAVSNFTKSVHNSAKSFVIPNLYTQGFKQAQVAFDMSNKEVKETYLGWLLRDIPIFRGMYNDQLDIFGNPVIPDTDKFFSGKDEDAPVYYEVAAGPLFNIKKPSIRTVKVEDPSTGEMTFLTPDEYYLFSKYRGEYLRDEIMKTVKAKKWDDFDKAYGTALQRDATYYAKDKIYDLRETYK